MKMYLYIVLTLLYDSTHSQIDLPAGLIPPPMHHFKHQSPNPHHLPPITRSTLQLLRGSDQFQPINAPGVHRNSDFKGNLRRQHPSLITVNVPERSKPLLQTVERNEIPHGVTSLTVRLSPPLLQGHLQEKFLSTFENLIFRPSQKLTTTALGNIFFPSIEDTFTLNSDGEHFSQNELSPNTITSITNENIANGTYSTNDRDLRNSGAPDSYVLQNNILYAPNNRSGSEISGWKPLSSVVAFPSEQVNPFPSYNTFANAFVTFPTTSLLETDTLGSPHHLLLRTTATPLVTELLTTDATTVSPLPAQERLNNADFNSIIGDYVTPQTAFLNTNFDESPIDSEEPKYTIHLNSTSRIKQLIQILKEFLKSPAHQLSGEFASLSETNVSTTKAINNFDENFLFNPFYFTADQLTDTTTERQLFQNGLLSLLHKNFTSNYMGNDKKSEITKLDLERSFSLSDHNLPIKDQYDLELNFSENYARPTPKPVKLKAITLENVGGQKFENYLLPSPPIISLLNIAKSQDESSSSDLAHFKQLGNAKSVYRQPNITGNITVTTKALECPKLFEQLNLVCEIVTDYDHSTLVKSWKKRSYSSQGLQFQQVLSLGPRLLVDDPRLSLPTGALSSYNLSIREFRIQDVASYECEVKAPSGQASSSYVVVFTCL